MARRGEGRGGVEAAGAGPWGADRDAGWVSRLGFHPLLGEWFYQRYSEPTEVQLQAWERISRGEHVLVSAPTGTGKTLAAFLWYLNQLIAGRLAAGRTSVLYVSPLKALNNDIRQNLLQPLAELGDLFSTAGIPFPRIEVLTRSGDSTAAERRRIARHPPAILITTPESLNLMLTARSGREVLTSVRCVVLDEVHSVVGNRRGVHLMTAVERLVRLAGEFQRVALSATIRPLDAVAGFVGGYALSTRGDMAAYRGRPVSVVRSAGRKKYGISVEASSMKEADPADPWAPLVEELRRTLAAHRSTLVFVNGRRLCEFLTSRINGEDNPPLAYAHHGSLSRETRLEVEQKLKRGELRAIVATSSLELGIDVGAVDHVVLVQAPPTVASAVQRLGRAGHQVGVASEGTLMPTHERDLLDLAVLSQAVLRHEIEATENIAAPLDVLAQVIVSMACAETWNLDELFAEVRCSYPYRNLGRRQFDAVVQMLAGRFARTRIRELKPRLSVDGLEGTAASNRGAEQAIYAGGGTIPDRGYFQMRHVRSNARLGELDEEFVWENREGSRFSLGAQSWRVERITPSDVFVSPSPHAAAAPFWKADGQDRGFHLAQEIGRFLEMAGARLEEPAFERQLQTEYALTPAAALQLLEYLRSQVRISGAELPHRHHLVVEHMESGPQGVPGNQMVLHTLWGGRVNRPFSLALEAAWEESFGLSLESYPTNDGVYLVLPERVEGHQVTNLVHRGNVDRLIRNQLESSGFFGARFRECAGRALLLGRGRPGQRTPLWMNRLRSRKLMDAVLGYEDFPILLEAWRTCLRDEFEMASLYRLLDEIASGEIRCTEVATATGSPFVRASAWGQVNQYMYMDDSPQGRVRSSIGSDWLQEVVFTDQLRPRVEAAAAAAFEARLQRLAPGFTPENGQALLDWLKERVAIPLVEWRSLLEGMERDHQLVEEDLLEEVGKKACLVDVATVEVALVCAVEDVARIAAAFFPGAEPRAAYLSGAPLPLQAAGVGEDSGSELLHQWLQFYGPRPLDFPPRSLGLPEPVLERLLQPLQASRKVVVGELLDSASGQYLCDAENLERIIRRGARRPSPEALPLRHLQWFLARQGGLLSGPGDEDGFALLLERLACLPAPASLWERDLFPARCPGYRPQWVDAAMATEDWHWIGCGRERIAFCLDRDAELMTREGEEPGKDCQSFVTALWSESDARYSFAALARKSGLSEDQVRELVWEAAWRGELSNDSFFSIRKGIETRFRAPEAGAVRRRGRRTTRAPGNWFIPGAQPRQSDFTAREERNKERVRLLIGRYGILFRELLQREAEAFRWSELFRTLRLMELSGELISGYFFEDIPGPQFLAPASLDLLQRSSCPDQVYWMNAADPLSLAGAPLEELRGWLPPRRASSHLVFCGVELLLSSERNGAVSVIGVGPEDSRLRQALDLFRHLLGRRVDPLSRIEMERINGEAASRSPFAPILKEEFSTVTEWDKLILLRS